jgi:putative ABC transport system ATP-binding protein
VSRRRDPAGTGRSGGDAVVVVRGVTHGRRSPGMPILDDVSLDVLRGEVVVVEGRSGSGKSTLCQLVAGLEAPDRGSVVVGGVPAATVRDWATLAFLPQRLGLPDELTVEENVTLPCWMRGLPGRPELMEALDLLHLSGRLTAQASRGEQQRVALARAAVLRPDVVVLDEPTSHQDEAHAEVVAREVVALARAGSAVLVATHDPRLVAGADRVVHLHAGAHRNVAPA